MGSRADLRAFRRRDYPGRTLSIDMSSAIATELRVNPFLHIDAERIYNPITDRALVAGEPAFEALKEIIDGGEIDDRLEEDGWLVRGDVSKLHRLKIVSLETMTAC